MVSPKPVCRRRAPAWGHRRRRSIWRRPESGMSRREKSRLLAEAISVTGYHRKALIRAWRRARADRGASPTARPDTSIWAGRSPRIEDDLGSGWISVVGAI